MKRILYSMFFVPFFTFTACEGIWFDCIEGNNNPAVIEREISQFDKIEVTGPFDVYITKADTFGLRIDAEENLIPEVDTRITGQKLIIETERGLCLRNNLPINIYVSTNNLKEARLTGSGLIQIDSVKYEYFTAKNTGSGDIEIDYLQTNKFTAKLTGSGEIEASGTATESEIEVLGSGNVRTINLLQNSCEALITGSGDTYVYVSGKLKATITGSGDIYYKGSPAVETNITGTGKVRKY